METGCDVAVIGAGFGGLAAGLALAEGGARVTVLEALGYPGGCASTFVKAGARFEAGATLFAGLDDDPVSGQLLGRWIKKHRMAVEIDRPDPILSFRTPGLTLTVGRDRAALVEQLCGLPGAPQRELRDFFVWQRAAADTLWSTLGAPELLPSGAGWAAGWSAGLAGRHLLRSPRYLPLLRWAGRPLSAVLAAFGLDRFAPLMDYLRGLCQITLQCAPEEAEAPFALGAMDYYWRGCGHIRGGIGRLAEAFVAAIRQSGGAVHLACRAKSLRPDGQGGWIVEARDRTIRCRRVVANLLPGDLERLMQTPEAQPPAPPALTTLQQEVEGGWSAVMLYRLYRPAPAQTLPPLAAHHTEIIQDPSQPCTGGNHLFLSATDHADPADPADLAAYRTLTASTHIDALALSQQTPEQRAVTVQRIQDRMRAGIAAFAPEFSTPLTEFPGSPRTFARFTRRHLGLVGGIPRRHGLHNYRPLLPGPLADRRARPLPGLYLVGDSVFPGQSVLSVAIGGAQTAAEILGETGSSP